MVKFMFIQFKNTIIKNIYDMSLKFFFLKCFLEKFVIKSEVNIMYISKLKQDAIIDLYKQGYSAAQIAIIFNESIASSASIVDIINKFIHNELKDDLPNNLSFNSILEKDKIDFDSFFDHLCTVFIHISSIQLINIVITILSLIQQYHLTDKIDIIIDKLKIFMGSDITHKSQELQDRTELKAYIEEIMKHHKLI